MFTCGRILGKSPRTRPRVYSVQCERRYTHNTHQLNQTLIYITGRGGPGHSEFSQTQLFRWRKWRGSRLFVAWETLLTLDSMTNASPITLEWKLPFGVAKNLTFIAWFVARPIVCRNEYSDYRTRYASSWSAICKSKNEYHGPEAQNIFISPHNFDHHIGLPPGLDQISMSKIFPVSAQKAWDYKRILIWSTM